MGLAQNDMATEISFIIMHDLAISNMVSGAPGIGDRGWGFRVFTEGLGIILKIRVLQELLGA